MARALEKGTGDNGNSGERELAPQEHGFYPLEQFRHEMDRLFDEFFGRSSLAQFPRRLFDWDIEPFGAFHRHFGAIAPRTDVHETEKAVTIEAELPGMEEKDIELTLSNGLLTLKGEKKEERKESDKDYHLSERSYGAFQRSFRVPDWVDQDKISAQFKKGVLTVSMPKTAQARKERKRIRIKS